MVNPTHLTAAGWPDPVEGLPDAAELDSPLLLVEIPADFQAIRAADPSLALKLALAQPGPI